MKNLLIGLLVLGLTNLGFSQHSQVEFLKSQMEDSNTIALNAYATTPSFNKDVSTNFKDASYMDILKEEATSNHVSRLEDQVSSFDLMASPEYDENKKYFKVIFKANKGSVVAVFDKNGEILTTKERYENIKLPVPVRNSLYKEFPNCNVEKIKYLLDYEKGKDVKKVYKIKIKKDNLTKHLKFDTQGNII